MNKQVLVGDLGAMPLTKADRRRVRQALAKAGVSAEAAQVWSSATPYVTGLSDHINILLTWARHFDDARQGLAWFESKVDGPKESLAWATKGYTPREASDASFEILRIAMLAAAKPEVLQLLAREEAWRNSGLTPKQVLDALRRNVMDPRTGATVPLPRQR